MKKTASLLFFILILKNSLLGNLILSEIEAGNLTVEENSAAGTIIGKITPVNLDSNKIKFSLKPTFPRGLSPKLWLDASDLNWAGFQWNDKSKNNNQGIIHGSANGYPSIKQNAHNGLSLMHYCGAVGSYHSFKEIKDIRTIFWVMRKKMGYSFMLGHDKLTHFHFNTGQFWWEKHASPHVLNGRLSINGNSIDGSKTDIPKDLSIISLRTTGDVTANNFSNDRNIQARFFNGDLGELIIFNETLSNYQIKEVESYLHRKWNLPLAYEPILPAFAISTDGVISSNRIFDHESTPKLPIQVRVTDDSNSSLHLKLDVTISDVIEDLDKDGVQDPYDHDIDGDGVNNLDELTYGTDPSDPNSLNRPATNLRMEENASIIENQPAGTVAGRLLAEDPDGDELFFSVEGQNFTIEQNGTVRTARAFDHETSASVSVTLIATDSRGVASSATFSVSIRDLPNDLDEDGVIDSADSDRDGDGLSNALELANFSDPDSHASSNYAPVDLNSTTTLTIIENRPANTVVGKFSATDQESPSNLRFALTGGQGDSGNGLFTLDANGTLRALNPFDFENNATQYSIRVAVFDEQNASMESSFEIDLLDEDTFSPISLNRNLVLWLDASDRATLDRGTYLGELGPPEDGNATLFWADKSGNEHHAIRSTGAGTFENAVLNGFPGIDTTGDTYEISNSAVAFDSWERMTVVIVYKWSKVTFWDKGIWKHGEGNGNNSVSGWSFDKMNPNNSHAAALWWARKDSTANRLVGNLNMDARSETKLITIRFDGTENILEYYADGSFQKQSNSIISRFISNQIEPLRVGGAYKWGEIFIFNDTLDDSDRQRVEGYLAHKWNLVQELDEYHPYKNGGIMDGSSIAISEELPMGTPMLQLSEIDPDYNASWSYSLVSPSEANDNQFFQLQDHDPFNPKEFDGLSLWLDASQLTTTPATWTDLSDQGNDADKIGSPSVVTNAQNGLSLMNYNANGQRHKFSMLEDIRTVFWVISQDASVNGSGFRFLLTRSTSSQPNPHWHNNNNGKFYGNYTNTKVKNGVTRMDGTVINGTVTNYPNNLSIISVRTTGDCIADSFGYDRGYTPRQWVGNLGELIIYNEPLTDQEIELIEVYLADKWNISHSSPNFSTIQSNVINYSSNYTLKTGAVFDFETNSSNYSIQVAGSSSTGQQAQKEYKIYLSNVVEDLDGDGIEDYYDLDDDGDGFYDLIEIAYPSDPKDPDSVANVAPHLINFTGDLSVPENSQVGTEVATFSATDNDGDSNFTYSIPKTIKKLEPVLWLDANHPSAKSSTWKDLSSYNRDAKRYNSPTVIENAQNGLSVMRYQASSSATDYHEWSNISNIRTVFAVFKRTGGSILSHNNSHYFWTNSTKIFHSGNTHSNVLNGKTFLNGLKVDGTVTNFPTSQFSLISLVTAGNVIANRIGMDRGQTNSSYHFSGDYAELVLFDQPLEDWEVESVEYSLAKKWGLQNNLAQTHSYKDKNSTLGHEHLTIDNNGTLTIAQAIDYETDQNFSITVRATDPHGASFDKLFTIQVTDIPEDVDGDGTPDHLDADIDGDGLSNEDELVGKSNPYDENSNNLPPTNIQENNTLTVSENLPSGTVISHFNGSDPDGNHTLSYLLFEGSSLPKPSTVYLRDSLLAYFPFDEINGTIAHNFGTDGSDANLLNGAEFVTNEKKFGRSALYFPWNMQQAQARIEKPVELGKDSQSDPFSISVWFKGLYNDQSKWRTLTRGKSLNHHVIIQQGAYNLGVHRNLGGGFIDSGFKLTPFGSASNWQHLVATMDSEKTNFYLDGSYVSTSLASPGHNIYTIGNHGGGGQLFAKYLDDFRIYGKTLSANEVITLHGNGNGDYSPFDLDVNGTLVTNSPLNYETDDHNYSLTVRAVDDYGAYVEQDFTIHLTNVLEDVNQDGVEDYDGNQSLSPTDIAVMGNGLKVSENAAVGSVVGQVKGVDPDGDAFHSFTLSTSADHTRFHPSSINGLTAWFDASDLATIQKVDGTNQLSTWRNKADYEVYLRPNIGKEPDANGSINGLNAVEFTAVDQISKRLWAYKNGANWNPMGVNGAASGKLTDGSLYMTFRSNKSTRTGFPFNFGWGDHFPWNNNLIYWQFSDMRRATNFSSNGEELMLCFEFSVSKGIQKLYKNGTVIMSGPRTTETNIGGAFFFPSDYGSQNIPEWTVGEILVVRGVMQHEEHLRTEGYLAHKWGLGNTLPDEHLYSRNYQSFDQSDVFLSIDNNGTLRTATTFDHEVDSNLSITIRVTDDEGLSFDKNFTIEISNIAEADLDGDGVEDLLDADWDGDGVSNWNEWQFNSDPMDQNSKNQPPSDIIASSLSFKENTPSGTSILNFSTSDPDENQTHSYQLLSDGKTGWRTALLTGDQDAGVEPSRSYTCAVNVNGADQVINGITFKGEAGLSGTGWEITSGFQSKHASQQSTVNGQVGKVLSNGMRFGGNPQKIKLTGLTIGKNYVFTLYSQAWGTETATREALISNSDSLLNITVNQNSYTSSTNDGILVECTYFAGSTTTEFTISPMTSSTWHLYAFSNYETSSLFNLNKNGHLSLEKTFDYETDEHSFPLTVKVTDDHNISFIKEFTLSLKNEIEDLDGDLIENHEDPDIDGDGVSNANEMLYGTDPWDNTSVNEPPNGWEVLEKLQIQENQPVGSLVGKIQGLDPQGSNTLNYSLIPQYPEQIKPVLWLDATDSSTFEYDEKGTVKRWENKIGTRHDFIQNIPDNRPSLIQHNLNNNNSVYFDGNDYMHSLGSINLGDNFSILMVAELEEIDSGGDALFSYNSNCEGGYFNFRSSQQGGFYGHYFSNETTGNNKVFFAQSQIGPALYELIFDLKQNFVQCFLNGTDKGKAPYTSAPGTHHIFRLFANLDISQHPKGSIGETLIFNSALPTPQRKEIESYLANKWNLTVDNKIQHHFFDIDNDGSIYSTKQFDYEKNENVSIKIRASDDYNMSMEKEFLISIENIIEDRDGDGIEDAYDFDFDNDGIVDEIDLDDDNDGITDLDEIIWGTDPFNQFSHAQVPIVRTLGYEGNTTNGYALLGEIITNGGAPITDLGILLSYDMKFNNIEPIGSIERNGKKFKLLVENFRYGTVLYYKAYVKNGVGLSNGGIKKIIIPQGKENILLWTQAKKLADGWHTSSWFGSFLPYANGWLYHADLGWLYSHSGPTADLWLWSAEHGWLWTASGIYPYLFQNSSANWLYFLIKKDGVARFYDYTTKSFK